MDKDMWEIIDSLNLSLRKAGGMYWNREAIGKMTALEMLETLAPNRIRFVYKANPRTVGTYIEVKDGDLL